MAGVFSEAFARGAGARENRARAAYQELLNQQADQAMQDQGTMRTLRDLYNQTVQYGGGDQDFLDMATQGGSALQGQDVLNAVQATRNKSDLIQQRRSMAITALAANDDKEFKVAKQHIYDRLTPEEQQQYGEPDTWDRTSIAAFVDPKAAEDMSKIRLSFSGRQDVERTKKELKDEKKDFTPKQIADMTRHNKDVAAAREFVDQQRAKKKSDQQISMLFPNEWSRAQKQPFDAVPYEGLAWGGAAAPTGPVSTDAAPLKRIDRQTATAILREAGGDKMRAREIARQRGYSF